MGELVAHHAVTEPLVTVLLPVRDGGDLLAEAIDSVLRQSLTALRLEIVDDGSTDGTAQMVADYAERDDRVRLFRNKRNKGRSRSLNEALERVETPYVARMDADDRCRPRRLEHQVSFLAGNPDVGLCGTWIRTFGDVEGAVWRLPTDPDRIRCELLFRSVLAHPTVLGRTASLRQEGLRYREDQHWAEDWDLWQRCAERFPLANVPEVHLDYRTSPPTDLKAGDDLSLRKRQEAHGIVAGGLARLGIEADEAQLELHRVIGFHDLDGGSPVSAGEIEDWLLHLRAANRTSGTYPTRVFESLLAREWLTICGLLARTGRASVTDWVRSPLARSSPPRLSALGKLLIRRAAALAP